MIACVSVCVCVCVCVCVSLCVCMCDRVCEFDVNISGRDHKERDNSLDSQRRLAKD